MTDPYITRTESLTLDTLRRLPSYFNEAEDLEQFPDMLTLCMVVLGRIADDLEAKTCA